jgi:hypothetical protein
MSAITTKDLTRLGEHCAGEDAVFPSLAPSVINPQPYGVVPDPVERLEPDVGESVERDRCLGRSKDSQVGRRIAS